VAVGVALAVTLAVAVAVGDGVGVALEELNAPKVTVKASGYPLHARPPVLSS
jgi:hypothetical protein